MLVGDVARRVGRSTETIKRWADDGLILCTRDERNRRVFSEEQVSRCEILARLSVEAQITNRKMSDLLARQPEQMPLLDYGA